MTPVDDTPSVRTLSPRRVPNRLRLLARRHRIRTDGVLPPAADATYDPRSRHNLDLGAGALSLSHEEDRAIKLGWRVD